MDELTEGKCDRDAILDVVEDLREHARFKDDAGNDSAAFYLFGIARRLEEACGVVDHADS